jgi:hypothetical protein
MNLPSDWNPADLNGSMLWPVVDRLTLRMSSLSRMSQASKRLDHISKIFQFRDEKFEFSSAYMQIWDTSRSIRCFWEGSLEKTVSYAFNIDMLDTQIVSFSGDSATASMDIQIGKGPNAPSVNGLVKIGDTLTMVVAIEGDPGFDVQVQECIAHDGDRANAVTLTDKNGCVLKKKLMGPWQKTTQTGRPGVSLVAFSFFQAFKFPDQMEVFLECNVELCKNGCDVCPEDASLVIISIEI